MKNISFYLILALLTLSACGGGDSADQLCRHYVTNEKVIQECKVALEANCKDSELGILSNCLKNPQSSGCIDSINRVRKTCRDTAQKLVKDCSKAAETSLLKPAITVGMCVEGIQKGCATHIKNARHCIKGNTFCTKFFLDSDNVPQNCRNKLADLLVNFNPDKADLGPNTGNLGSFKSASVKGACEEAEKRHRLKQGNSTQCTTALEIVCAAESDIADLEKCAKGDAFCRDHFLKNMTPKCRNVAKNYIVGIN